MAGFCDHGNECLGSTVTPGNLLSSYINIKHSGTSPARKPSEFQGKQLHSSCRTQVDKTCLQRNTKGPEHFSVNKGFHLVQARTCRQKNIAEEMIHVFMAKSQVRNLCDICTPTVTDQYTLSFLLSVFSLALFPSFFLSSFLLIFRMFSVLKFESPLITVFLAPPAPTMFSKLCHKSTCFQYVCSSILSTRPYPATFHIILSLTSKAATFAQAVFATRPITKVYSCGYAY
jgi:hypothetical protein